jgi:dTDP-4-dehydrorhamnose reductase
MKRILITGSGGFIGNFLFNFLKKKKNIKIFGTINKSINKNKELKKIRIPKKFITNNIFRCDLSKLKEVKRIISKIKPDIIYHFAAMSNHSYAEKNKNKCKKNNSKITKNIIQCINKNCKFIFLSSDKVYAGDPKLSLENINLKPPGYLAKEKIKCEKEIIKSTRKYFILRLPIVHHIGKYKKISTIDSFLFELKKNKKIYVFKNIKRSFLKINEFILFLEKLIHSEKYGIYNVGSKILSYSDRINNLCKIYKIKSKNKIVKLNGKIFPLIQNFNTSAVNKKFNIIFT